jgi:hypothetical protein
MKNCIFVCIFNNVNYVKMFYLLLESIYIYGNLADDIDIVIYTSTEFMKIIKQSHLFNDKIKFEINDTFNNIEKACNARLNCFTLKSISNYKKILYLDIDILIKDDIHKIFDVVEKDILYVLEEGTIEHIDHGGFLFGKEIDDYPNKEAFTSGILLFNNCGKMRELFENIKQHMIDDYHCFPCPDQSYIVYNAFKYNLFDNKILKLLVVNNNYDIHSDKIIHHFPGGVGIYKHKIVNMTQFLNKIKDYTININIYNAKQYINRNLLPIINNCGELLEGNIFMLHHTTIYSDTLSNKARNISNFVLNKNIMNVMEIGFNSGFSALLMLLSNPNLQLTCFDLGEHSYTLPCYKMMKETFGDRINIIIGDSTKTLPYNVSEKYDLIHIDGGHSTVIAENDIRNSYRLSKQGTILIMDNYNFQNLHTLWDSYIINYNLKMLDISIYDSRHHDVKYVNT